MPNVIIYILYLIQILIGYHLVFPLLLFVIHKFFRWPINKSSVGTTNDYGIIVTAYEQVNQVPAVIDSLVKMNYENYIIYVVADNVADVSSIENLSPRVRVLRPPSVLKSNTKSHFFAIKHFDRPHTHITIIDSDNLVNKEYLNQLDVFFNQGFEAVQGVRNPKNLNTTYACLDAARDIYYHFYDGKILFQLGSSATLAGSGMAFTTQLYKDCLENKGVEGAGFDKVLQYQILRRNKRIAFTLDAEVLDEKTTQTQQLVNQRARWINTWFKYFSYGFSLVGMGLKNMSWNQFLFGLVLLRPPLFLFLLSGIVCLGINIFFVPWVALIWAGAFFAFAVGFMLALWSSNTPAVVYKSLKGIPLFMFYQVKSLLLARKANQISVATKHFENTTH
ncbi:MAG: glycosyltransferase [Bacteroidetes bacterium]|nr:MAG: glycosyltransferase [Bacteroidota bacterium]TAF93587.1 MAG: glycosyltransferase [Bacteroidota bacterium]